MVSKEPVGLRMAPATVAMVDDLVQWLDAPSKAWVWETAIARWHAVEEAKRGIQLAQEEADQGDG
jgi:hypothetical protein